MQDNLDRLLEELEQTTDTLLQFGLPSGEVALDWTALEEPIRQRGALISEVSQILRSSEFVEDSDYDRLLTIQRLGDQITRQLQAARSQLALATTRRTAQHAYRDCLEGMVSPVVTRHVDTV
jgi:hypothetical protein